MNRDAANANARTTAATGNSGQGTVGCEAAKAASSSAVYSIAFADTGTETTPSPNSIPVKAAPIRLFNTFTYEGKIRHRLSYF